MNRTLQQVLKSGGEGLILRGPHSLYTAGRSDSFYKLKVQKKKSNIRKKILKSFSNQFLL